MRRKQRQYVSELTFLNDFGFNIVHQGIYCLFCEDDTTYVGQSKRMQTRYLEHENKKPKRCFILEHIDNPSGIFYRKIVSVDKVLDTCEALWIAILDPDLNIQRPKLHIDERGFVSGYCVKQGESYEKPSQQLMRKVASALNWPLEKQNKWMGELFLGS